MILESTKQLRFKGITLTFLLLGAEEILSAEIQNELVIPVTIQYESNPSFSSDNETSLYKKIITPQFISSVQDNRNLWRADISYNLERSSDTNISDDREDPTIDLSWRHELETGNFSIAARMEEGPTRETELYDSGLITFDGTRKSKSASMNWTKNLSEILSFSLSGSGTETTYQNIGLVDYRTRAATARANYRLSETLLTFLDIGKTRYESIDNQISSNSRQISIGSQVDISETTVGILSLGVSDTENSDDEGKENQGSFTLNFEEERLEFSLTISRSIYPSGGGGFIKADQFRGMARYDLAETSNVGFEANIRKNFDIEENKTRALSITYNKELGEMWNVVFRGSRNEIESNAIDTLINNTFSISMSYTI